jgi:hypothetical protein
MINENFKIRVNNPEESIFVQKLLFQNGSKWRNGKSEVNLVDSQGSSWKGLYHYLNNTITGDATIGGYFHNHDNPEITLEEFKIRYFGKGETSRQTCIDFAKYCMDHLNDELTIEQLFDNFIKPKNGNKTF